MRFIDFCTLCHEVAEMRSRSAKTSAVAAFLTGVSPSERSSAIAFLLGRPFPLSDPRRLDVSWATVRELRETLRDAPGIPTLTIQDIAERLGAVADSVGQGSRRGKRDHLQALFNQATADEREVLRHILVGEMRIGLHEGLIQEAIARAAGVEAGLVRRTAQCLADLSEVGSLALAEGRKGLEQVGPRLFVPLVPMLAELSHAFGDIFERHPSGVALEYKYDGARIQLHKQGTQVRIWSRRLSEITGSLPDVVQAVQCTLHGEAFILDGEAVAIGHDGRPLPFQELMRRFRRVHEIDAAVRDVPLALYFFDCLVLEGRSLLDWPYQDRWNALLRVTGGIHLVERVLPGNSAEAEAFLSASRAAGHEGVMAKALDSRYTPGSRGKQWYKVKPAETLDCVVVAADWGSGRRRGWLSNYHLAVIDGTGAYRPVGKTFKGFTDGEFAAMTERLQRLAIRANGPTVTVKPEVVVDGGGSRV